MWICLQVHSVLSVFVFCFWIYSLRAYILRLLCFLVDWLTHYYMTVPFFTNNFLCFEDFPLSWYTYRIIFRYQVFCYANLFTSYILILFSYFLLPQIWSIFLHIYVIPSNVYKCFYWFDKLSLENFLHIHSNHLLIILLLFLIFQSQSLWFSSVSITSLCSENTK